MSAIDAVKALMNALEANERDTAANYLADHFMATGWTPAPLNKKDFLDVIGGLKEGIPGLIFNLHNVDEVGNTVHGTIQIAGYQTDSFNIPTLSLPPIPQMGRSVSLPAQDVDFTIENELVAFMHIHHVEGGSIRGLLHQLGTDSAIIQ